MCYRIGFLSHTSGDHSHTIHPFDESIQMVNSISVRHIFSPSFNVRTFRYLAILNVPETRGVIFSNPMLYKDFRPLGIVNV